jgi:uncharacterized protein YfiM (DUF2279 family)
MPHAVSVAPALNARAVRIGVYASMLLALTACSGPSPSRQDALLEAPFGCAIYDLKTAPETAPKYVKAPRRRGLGRVRPSMRGLAAGAEPDPWLTRGQKTLLLNGGAAAALTAWGVYKWDYGQRSPNASREHWFGQTTEEGGADKFGHFWSSYALSHLFSSVYESWDYSEDEATTYGALSSLGFHTLMEFGDSFSEFGFSYEDMLMNLAGAGAGYLLRAAPEIGEKIDFRIEYAPSLDGGNDTDVFTDYEHQKFVMAVKGEGFESMRGSIFEYLEFQTGYFARGYEGFTRGTPETRRRSLYIGLGLNVGKIVEPLWDTALFDYFQVPGTYIPFDAKLDQ